MPQDSRQGLGSSLVRFGLAGFDHGRMRRAIQRPGAPIDQRRHGLLFSAAAGQAAPHLRGQIVRMGVNVALGAQVGGAVLEGGEPAVDRRMGGAQWVGLVVGE